MDLTIYVPTRNNQSTIAKLLHSLRPLEAQQIVVADFESDDSTREVCTESGCVVRSFPAGADRSDTLNRLLSETEWHLFVRPGEALIHGHEKILRATQASYHFTIVQESLITKEVRLWRRDQGARWRNPVYEYIDLDTRKEIGATLYSGGTNDHDHHLSLVRQWQEAAPAAAEPHYYHACTLLGMGRHEDFLRVARHFLSLDSRTKMSTIMLRYHYALVHLLTSSDVKPVLQNLNLCLCAKPLMAEFWCLLGDVYFHRLRKFVEAREFYRNAVCLGRRRLRSDLWPMDVSKYEDYPEKMIALCRRLIESQGVYVVSR